MDYRKMTKEGLISEIKLLKSKLEILEHKPSKDDSKKHHNQLAKQLAERNKELTTTKKKLQLGIVEHKKTEEQIYKITHDFNNGLQSILGHITLAKRHTKKNDQNHKELEDAKKAILQSKSLTRQLLTISKGKKPVKIAME
ncbi:MAG: hypothetical protein ACYSWS_10140 [Planctomycetota bacterium]|jgi:signal transduction histidine kinase